MKQVFNLLCGTVDLTVTGAYPERLLNLCAQENLVFWGLNWYDEHTINLCVRRRDLAEFETLCRRIGCERQVVGRKGLPFFLERFRRRYAFLLGLVCSISAVCILSGFILTIEVSGNTAVSAAEILFQLRTQGVRPGAYGPSLDRKEISQAILLQMDELSWMTLNLYGTRLEVLVMEAVKPPELETEDGVYDVVATADGLITKLEALSGEALVSVGDIVTKGQVLIRGNVELKPPAYSDAPSQWLQVRANGVVQARTWRTISASIPLSSQVKEYTGEEKTVWVLDFFGSRVDFFGNNSTFRANYDKINSIRQLSLPGEVVLPVYFGMETYRGYEVAHVSINQEAAQSMLEERLLVYLRQMISGDGEIVATEFSARVRDGLLTVTLTAECLESIAKQVSATPLAAEPGINAEE